jgi:hypothetical protein
MILKDFNKKMSNEIEKVSIPSLDKYLSTKFASSSKKLHVCEFCNNYSSSTLKALSAHIRACKIKPKPVNEISNISLAINENSIDPISSNEIMETITDLDVILTIPETKKEIKKPSSKKNK